MPLFTGPGHAGDKTTGDHKAAVANMNHEQVHKLVEQAQAGKFGPEAQKMAQQAMQAPQPAAEPDGDEGQQAPTPKRSFSAMFSGEPDGDEQAAPAPARRAAMFSGSR